MRLRLWRRAAALPQACWVCVPGTPGELMCDPCNEWMCAVVQHQAQPCPDPALRPRRKNFGPILVSPPGVTPATNETGPPSEVGRRAAGSVTAGDTRGHWPIRSKAWTKMEP